mmetsp:Transcript_44479/g.68092  ORF Transcript_44479/g.68092 Transcript_44479/m.68092 type:complete len:550 (+) Transcript_44479:1034-2683(+)
MCAERRSAVDDRRQRCAELLELLLHCLGLGCGEQRAKRVLLLCFERKVQRIPPKLVCLLRIGALLHQSLHLPLQPAADCVHERGVAEVVHCVHLCVLLQQVLEHPSALLRDVHPLAAVSLFLHRSPCHQWRHPVQIPRVTHREVTVLLQTLHHFQALVWRAALDRHNQRYPYTPTPLGNVNPAQRCPSFLDHPLELFLRPMRHGQRQRRPSLGVARVSVRSAVLEQPLEHLLSPVLDRVDQGRGASEVFLSNVEPACALVSVHHRQLLRHLNKPSLCSVHEGGSPVAVCGVRVHACTLRHPPHESLLLLFNEQHQRSSPVRAFGIHISPILFQPPHGALPALRCCTQKWRLAVVVHRFQVQVFVQDQPSEQPLQPVSRRQVKSCVVVTIRLPEICFTMRQRSHNSLPSVRSSLQQCRLPVFVLRVHVNLVLIRQPRHEVLVSIGRGHHQGRLLIFVALVRIRWTRFESLCSLGGNQPLCQPKLSAFGSDLEQCLLASRLLVDIRNVLVHCQPLHHLLLPGLRSAHQKRGPVALASFGLRNVHVIVGLGF